MTRLNFDLARRALIACVVTASLLAVPTALAAPAEADETGHWLSLSYLTDLVETVGHWAADLSSVAGSDDPKADGGVTPQDDGPSLSTRTTEGGSDVGPSLDPTG